MGRVQILLVMQALADVVDHGHGASIALAGDDGLHLRRLTVPAAQAPAGGEPVGRPGTGQVVAQTGVIGPIDDAVGIQPQEFVPGVAGQCAESRIGVLVAALAVEIDDPGPGLLEQPAVAKVAGEAFCKPFLLAQAVGENTEQDAGRREDRHLDAQRRFGGASAT